MENLLIYGSICDMLDDLTNEEAGLLFKALNNFRKGIPVTFEDRYLQGVWIGILPNLNNLKKNYEKKVSINKENGKKGGRPTKEQQAANKVHLNNDKSKVVSEPISTEIEAEIEDMEEVTIPSTRIKVPDILDKKQFIGLGEPIERYEDYLKDPKKYKMTNPIEDSNF